MSRVHILKFSANLPNWFQNFLKREFGDELSVFNDTVEEFNDTVEESNDSLFIITMDEAKELSDSFAHKENCVLITEASIDSDLDFLSTHDFPHSFHIGSIGNESVWKNRLQEIRTKQVTPLYDLINNHKVHRVTYLTPMEIEEKTSLLLQNLIEYPRLSQLRTVLIETITNAFFYGAKSEDPTAKFDWNINFTLQESNSIEVEFISDGPDIIFSVIDKGGKFSSRTMLHWLNRQTSPGENGLPIGIYDTHGRGLFITRKMVDYFQVNVIPGKRSECRMFMNLEKENPEFRDISILQLSD